MYVQWCISVSYTWLMWHCCVSFWGKGGCIPIPDVFQSEHRLNYSLFNNYVHSVSELDQNWLYTDTKQYKMSFMLNKAIPELRKLSIPWKTPWKKNEKINLMAINKYSHVTCINTDHFDSQQKEKSLANRKVYLQNQKYELILYHLNITLNLDQSQIQINYPPCGWYSSMNSTKMNWFSSDASICVHVTITLQINNKNRSKSFIFCKFAVLIWPCCEEKNTG